MSSHRNQLGTGTKGRGSKHRKETQEPKKKHHKSPHMTHYSTPLPEGTSSSVTDRPTVEGGWGFWQWTGTWRSR